MLSRLSLGHNRLKDQNLPQRVSLGHNWKCKILLRWEPQRTQLLSAEVRPLLTFTVFCVSQIFA